ncbi:MAG: copper-binding protein [Alphaproteobacteria bacterium]|nr:copper-binding protein [Alphaproteobacteria bacterium]
MMKRHIQTVALLLAAAALSLSLPAMGQMTMDHSKMGMAAAPGMADGEVRKIDKDNNRITIRHGEIKHLDMPPMTMVFTAKDKAMLDKVKVGEKIQFIAIQEAGKMVVTDIQPGK